MAGVLSRQAICTDSDLLRRAVCRAGDGGGLPAGSASD